MGKLNKAKLEALSRSKKKEDQKLWSDGDRLYLDNRNKRLNFVFRYRRSGNNFATSVVIGKYPAVSLAEARNKANAFNNMLYNRQDPYDENQEAIQKAKAKTEAKRNYDTLMDIAEEWFVIQTHTGKWNTAKKVDDCRNNFSKFVVPIVKDKNIKDITTADIVRVLEQKVIGINGKKGHFCHIQKPTAKKTKEWLQALFRFADVKGYIDTNNVTHDKISFELVKEPDEIKYLDTRHKALDYKFIKKFVNTLASIDDDRIRMLEWTVLTAGRTEEILQTEWSEIDLENGIWTVPRHKTKKKKSEDIIALSKQAIALIKHQQKKHNINSKYVFTNADKGTWSTSALRYARDYIIGEPYNIRNGELYFRPHGFRSTCATYLIDNGYDETTVKRILNQKVADTVLQHYDSADFIDKKREALQLYADYCYPKGYKR